MQRVRAFSVRGLVGQIFSRGMNTLAGILNQNPNVSCTVQEHGVFYCENVPHLTSAMALSSRAYVLIGHSNGADAILMMAHRLKVLKKRVALLVAVDPTPLSMPVPDNVDLAMGFYERLPGQLGGAIIKDDATDPRVVPIILKQEFVTHVAIDDLDAVHQAVAKAVSRITGA